MIKINVLTLGIIAFMVSVAEPFMVSPLALLWAGIAALFIGRPRRPGLAAASYGYGLPPGLYAAPYPAPWSFRNAAFCYLRRLFSMSPFLAIAALWAFFKNRAKDIFARLGIAVKNSAAAFLENTEKGFCEKLVFQKNEKRAKDIFGKVFEKSLQKIFLKKFPKKVSKNFPKNKFLKVLEIFGKNENCLNNKKIKTVCFEKSFFVKEAGNFLRAAVII